MEVGSPDKTVVEPKLQSPQGAEWKIALVLVLNVETVITVGQKTSGTGFEPEGSPFS